MPLASLFNLQWYGTASGAMVSDVVMPIQQLSMRQNKGLSLDVTVTLPTAVIYGQRGKNGVLDVQISLAIATLVMKKRLRAVLDVAINKLSQDDVTGAVLDVEIEAGVTLRSAIKILLAINAGKTNITDLGGGLATVQFRDLTDSLNRVEADMTGSERTDVTINL